jgi:hypothetical protein
MLLVDQEREEALFADARRDAASTGVLGIGQPHLATKRPFDQCRRTAAGSMLTWQAPG